MLELQSIRQMMISFRKIEKYEKGKRQTRVFLKIFFLAGVYYRREFCINSQVWDIS